MDIKSILRELEGLSHSLYVDGLQKESEKLDNAIDAIRDIMDYVIPTVM